MSRDVVSRARRMGWISIYKRNVPSGPCRVGIAVLISRPKKALRMFSLALSISIVVLVPNMSPSRTSGIIS